MKHLPTTVLLDLADDLVQLVEWRPSASPGAGIKLAEIDEELLSRAPEGEFVTLLDESGIPVGFEPYLGV